MKNSIYVCKNIYAIFKNYHGGYVIYGDLVTVRQYYGYTKSQAIKKYQAECKINGMIYNQPQKVKKNEKNTVNQ